MLKQSDFFFNKHYDIQSYQKKQKKNLSVAHFKRLVTAQCSVEYLIRQVAIIKHVVKNNRRNHRRYLISIY